MTRGQVQAGRLVRFEPKATFKAHAAATYYAGMDGVGKIYDGKIRRQRERDGSITEVARVRFDGPGYQNYVWVRLTDMQEV